MDEAERLAARKEANRAANQALRSRRKEQAQSSGQGAGDQSAAGKSRGRTHEGPAVLDDDNESSVVTASTMGPPAPRSILRGSTTSGMDVDGHRTATSRTVTFADVVKGLKPGATANSVSRKDNPGKQQPSFSGTMSVKAKSTQLPQMSHPTSRPHQTVVGPSSAASSLSVFSSSSIVTSSSAAASTSIGSSTGNSKSRRTLPWLGTNTLKRGRDQSPTSHGFRGTLPRQTMHTQTGPAVQVSATSKATSSVVSSSSMISSSVIESSSKGSRRTLPWLTTNTPDSQTRVSGRPISTDGPVSPPSVVRTPSVVRPPSVIRPSNVIESSNNGFRRTVPWLAKHASERGLLTPANKTDGDAMRNAVSDRSHRVRRISPGSVSRMGRSFPASVPIKQVQSTIPSSFDRMSTTPVRSTIQSLSNPTAVHNQSPSPIALPDGGAWSDVGSTSNRQVGVSDNGRTGSESSKRSKRNSITQYFPAGNSPINHGGVSSQSPREGPANSMQGGRTPNAQAPIPAIGRDGALSPESIAFHDQAVHNLEGGNGLDDVRMLDDTGSDYNPDQTVDGYESLEYSDSESKEHSDSSANISEDEMAHGELPHRTSTVQKANMCLKVFRETMSGKCHCDAGFGPVQDRGLGLGEMANAIKKHLDESALPEPGRPWKLPAKRNFTNGWPKHNLPALLSGIQGRDDGQLGLSFRKTEFHFRKRIEDICRRRVLDAFPITIESTFDIDSFMARMRTLAACKTDWSLSFIPRYLRQITQPMVVTMNGVDVTKVKHIEIGRPVDSSVMTTYIVFPNAEADKANNFLNVEEQKIWINRILLPSLLEATPKRLHQYYPRSWEDVNLKARCKAENVQVLRDASEKVAVDKTVPAGSLGDLWARILDRCRDLGVRAWEGPFLVTVGHDLKLLSSRDSCEDAMAQFLGRLEPTYALDMMAQDDTWIDLGRNDFPVVADDEVRREIGAITLMRKSACSKEWAVPFQCPKSETAKTQVAAYPMCGTRDAGNVTVDLTKTNMLFDKGRMAHAKAYSLHKEVLYAPVKGIIPYQSHLLESLAFDDEHIEAWYGYNSKYGSRGRNVLSSARRQFQDVTTRVLWAMHDQKHTTYGVRQEYRMNLYVARAINLDRVTGLAPKQLATVSTDGNNLTATDGHDRFWLLPTIEVNQLHTAECLRWVACISAVSMQTEPTLQSPGLDRQQQLQNSLLIKVYVSALHHSMAGKNLAKMGSIWKSNEYDRREAIGQGRTAKRRIRGIGVGQMVNDTGMTFIPEDFFEEGHRTIRHALVREGKLGIGSNSLQRQLKSRSGIQKQLARTNRMAQALSRKPDARERGIDPDSEEARTLEDEWLGTLVQWAIAVFVQDTWMVIAGKLGKEMATQAGGYRRMSGPRKTALEAEMTDLVKRDMRKRLGRNGWNGFEGLTPELARKALDCSHHFFSECVSVTKSYTPNGTSHFPTSSRYGLWEDKLYDLFRLELEPGESQHHTWSSMRFRGEYTEMCLIAQKEIGEGASDRIRKITKGLLVQNIWTVLQFDHTKFSVTAKSSAPGLSRRRKEIIQSKTVMGKLRWILPAPISEVWDPRFDGDIYQRDYTQVEVDDEDDIDDEDNYIRDPDPTTIMQSEWRTRFRDGYSRIESWQPSDKRVRVQCWDDTIGKPKKRVPSPEDWDASPLMIDIMELYSSVYREAGESGWWDDAVETAESEDSSNGNDSGNDEVEEEDDNDWVA